MDEQKSIAEILYRLPLSLMIPLGITTAITLILLCIRLFAFCTKRRMNRYHDPVMLFAAPVVSLLLGLMNVTANITLRGNDSEFAAAHSIHEMGSMLIVGCVLFHLSLFVVLLPDRYAE